MKKIFIAMVLAVLCLTALAYAGNLGTRDSDYVLEGGDYLIKMDFLSDNETIKYIGRAQPGSLDNASAWQIKKVTYLSDNSTVTSITYAGGSNKYASKWSTRTIYTYK